MGSALQLSLGSCRRGRLGSDDGLPPPDRAPCLRSSPGSVLIDCVETTVDVSAAAQFPPTWRRAVGNENGAGMTSRNWASTVTGPSRQNGCNLRDLGRSVTRTARHGDLFTTRSSLGLAGPRPFLERVPDDLGSTFMNVACPPPSTAVRRPDGPRRQLARGSVRGNRTFRDDAVGTVDDAKAPGESHTVPSATFPRTVLGSPDVVSDHFS